MITIIEYECEICGARYSARRAAEQCEKRGVTLDASVRWPIGLLVNGSSFYKDITFGVAEVGPLRSYDAHVQSGEWVTASWAWRDNGYGDNTGGERCTAVQPYLHANTDTDAPHFKRAVAWLRDNNVTPLIIKDGKIAIYDAVL